MYRRKKRKIVDIRREGWFIAKICREEFCRRMAVTASFGNPSEYEKSQLSWAPSHGITSVTGLRLLKVGDQPGDHMILKK